MSALERSSAAVRATTRRMRRLRAGSMVEPSVCRTIDASGARETADRHADPRNVRTATRHGKTRRPTFAQACWLRLLRGRSAKPSGAADVLAHETTCASDPNDRAKHAAAAGPP